jgi:NhaP-type Na+/H+ and K+/H+ antiporters
MPHHVILAITALLFLLFGALSKRLETSVLSAPMLCVLLGSLAGPLGFGWVELSFNSDLITIVGEIALAVILFSDASGVAVRDLRSTWAIPARLLAIGLPLTMAAGTLVAIPLFPDVPLAWLGILACILAPTDAALGIAVVQSPLVPLHVRETLNVESGLNDGIALPPILVLMTLIGSEEAGHAASHGWLLDAAKELGLGALAGAAIGHAGGRLLDVAWQRGWMNETYIRLVAPGLAVFIFAAANLATLNGFVAAYFGGLFLGVREPEFRTQLREFGEADGTQFSLFVFLVFGLMMLPVAAPHWDWRALAYALLSLTVVRMLPVALSLIGTGIDRTTAAFIGWSGPRGIASVLYLSLVVDQFGFAGQERIFSVVVLTVLLSILLHGATAAPSVTAYGRRESATARD